jgi:hypothetical protein
LGVKTWWHLYREIKSNRNRSLHEIHAHWDIDSGRIVYIRQIQLVCYIGLYIYKKCECLFRLHGYFLVSIKWKLTVVCGEHNHHIELTFRRSYCCWSFESEWKESCSRDDKKFGILVSHPVGVKIIRNWEKGCILA